MSIRTIYEKLQSENPKLSPEDVKRMSIRLQNWVDNEILPDIKSGTPEVVYGSKEKTVIVHTIAGNTKHTWTLPLSDYLDIKAMQYGFENYENMKRQGFSIICQIKKGV